MNFLTALNAAEETAAQISFQPANFIENLKYMGIGMLVIFAVIGVIVLTTMLINKVFAD
jgi:hypothetical protein